jgi:DNA adenine methylase
MTVPLRPPIAYFGSKVRIAPRIVEYLPPHRGYVEPYCGSLAVLFAKPPSVYEVVNDLDGDLVCVASSTRILAADLTWRAAGDVQVGDELIGFDETNGPATPGLRAPSRYRRWRTTTVEAVAVTRKPCYRLTFDDGTQVIASEDHMWLGGSHTTGGRGWRWQTTKGLVCDRKVGRSWLLKLCDVTEPERTWDAGWLAGFYDGEGNVISAGARQSGWRLSVSQKLGPEADLCARLLKDRGFDVRSSVRTRGENWQPVETLTLAGGMREVLRFLMLTRPQRLVANFVRDCLPHASLYGRSHQAVGLVAKEYLGEREVMAIQTDARTYVAEGLASHNCFWRVLRTRVDDLERVCRLTPHAREEYRQSWPIGEDCDDLERARRVWVKLTQARGGSLRTTGWRYHEGVAGRSSSMPRTLQGYLGRFAPVAERLMGVSLECRPALEVVERYGRDPGQLLYVDPPYLYDTRGRRARSHGSEATYRHDMGSEEEHRELAAALAECRSTVVLSAYHSPLYDDLYSGWDHVEIESGTGQNAEAGWQLRTEVLWCNRPLARQVGLWEDAR